MTSDSSPKDPSRSTPTAATEPLPAHVVPAGLAWAAVVAIGGGLIGGLLLVKFRMIGYVSLMVIGVLGGAVSRRISRRAVPLLGWALVVAVLLALVVAQVYFIRFAFRDVDSWSQALAEWPKMVTSPSFRVSTAVGLMCAGLGAHSAYWRAGKRFRRVIVMDD